MKYWLIVAALLGLSACQSLQHAKDALLTPAARAKKLVLEPSWVRSTTQKDFLEYRRLNRMTPLADDKRVWIGNGIDGISAFQRHSGHRLWHFAVKGGVEAGAQLLDDKLYFGGNDGFFYSLDATTGKELWRFSIRFEGLGAPLIRSNRVYFLAGNNVTYALEAQTGKLIWSYARTEGAIFSIRGGSQPTLVGETLYVGASDGALVALNARDGSLIWERLLSQNDRFKDIDATPVIENDLIYISNYDGSLYCLSRVDGQIIWRYDEGSAFSVTLGPDALYYATTGRKIVSLNKQTGKVNWSHALETGLPTQPALHRGFLIFGTQRGPLEVRRTQDGVQVAGYSPGRGLSAAPLIYGEEGAIYFISNDANLYSMVLRSVDSKAFWPWDEVR